MTESHALTSLYLDAKERILALADDDNATTNVPATPVWSIHDVVAHQVGTLQDFLNGETKGAPGDAWTARHIERFQDADMSELTASWKVAMDQAGPGMERIASILLPDIVTHELDIRGALGNRDCRDMPGLTYAFQALLGNRRNAFARLGLPTLRIVADDQEGTTGDGTAVATLRTSLFVANRVLTGRRSFDQVRAMEWTGDPEPFLEHLSVLGQRDADLIE